MATVLDLVRRRPRTSSLVTAPTGVRPNITPTTQPRPAIAPTAQPGGGGMIRLDDGGYARPGDAAYVPPNMRGTFNPKLGSGPNIGPGVRPNITPTVTPAQQSLTTRGGSGPTPGIGAGLATAAGISPEQQAAIKQQAQAQIGLRPPTPSGGGVGGPNIGPIVPRPPDDDFITPFGPGNDLRGEQINPLASARLRGTQGTVDTARTALAGGPSLSEAALEQFRLLGEGTAENRTRGIREIGQGAARLGRLGSGMVTTDLGNLEDVLRTREEQARRGLAADVAQGEAGNRRANLAALMGLEGQQFGQEAGQRGELRTERGYQAETARDAVQNRIQQRLLEEQLLNSAFGRELAGAELGLRGSELYGEDAAASGELTQDLLAELGRARAGRRRTGPSTKTSDAVYDRGYA